MSYPVTESKHSTTLQKRLLIVVFLLLVVYGAVQIARAQETPPLPANTDAENEIPTGETPSEFENMDQPLTTPTMPEPLMLPTDAETNILVATNEPPLAAEREIDVVITPSPTETITAPSVSTDEVAPINPTASISITTNTTDVTTNGILSLQVSGEHLSDIYGAAVACRVNPLVLQGIQATNGDMFLLDQLTITDSGFQPDGYWIVIGTQYEAAIPLASTGTLWTFDYRVVATGNLQIDCQVQINDANRVALQLFNSTLSLSLGSDADVGATSTPVAPAAETTAPTNVVSTAMVTDVAAAEAVQPTPLPAAHVFGQVESVLPLIQASISINGTAFEQVLDVQTNGNFGFDLQPSDYQLTYKARSCLPEVITVTVEEGAQRLPTVTLTCGDVDGNMVIDEIDAGIITENFGLVAAKTTSLVDLNQDGAVDILDLVLVSIGFSANTTASLEPERNE